MPRYFWHPSVVYIPEGFGGHQWWMAQSPYHPGVKLKPYQSRWELPCVHWSDDGITWYSIAHNPVDDVMPELLVEEDFLSDPHLVYKDGVLELYYRLTLQKNKVIYDSKTLLYKRTSTDGETWSARTLIADLRRDNDIEIWGEQIISQAIVWTGKEYQCWYIDKSWYIADRRIRKTTSVDGIHWNENCICDLRSYSDIPWHIDVQYINGKYHLLCYSDKVDRLSHLISDDGINWDFDTIILTHSKSLRSFYSGQIYRSCLVLINETYRIYFSAATSFRSYVGLLTTKDWKQFDIVSPLHNKQYERDMVMLILRKVIRKCTKPLRKILEK